MKLVDNCSRRSQHIGYRQLAALAVGCIGLASSSAASAYQFDDDEAAYDQRYLQTTISVTGQVLDEGGRPIPGAKLTLVAWGENAANDGITATAGADGRFELAALTRRAALLKIGYSGYYPELIPLDLQQPLATTRIALGNIVLSAQMPGRARLIFAGDTMMARDYIDGDGDGVTGEPGDLVRPATAEADTVALFRYVREVLTSDDHTSVNLETAVTSSVDTPHPTKSHVFFTYPDSLLAFPQVGIESVSLGNNHIYDYLESGFGDTLEAVEFAGLGWYGAGLSESSARRSQYRESMNGIKIAMQGFNELIGTHYGGPELYMLALDEPITKGGALGLNSANVTEFLAAEADTHFAIPVMHGGTEYEYRQTSAMREQFRLAIEHGAGLVVAHHPHYSGGVGVYDAGAGPRFILSSLGNFIFDQDFQETTRSYVAMVEIDYSPAGPQVSQVRLIPFRMDGNVPRLLVGHALERMGRFIGHLSAHEGQAGDGITGATVFAERGHIVALASAADAQVSQSVESTDVVMSGQQSGIIQFEPRGSSDFLARVVTGVDATCELGRDILWTGNFEEEDVDELVHEGDRWSQNSSRYLQNSQVYKGNGAAVILRSRYNSSYSALAITNSIRVTPGSQISVTGFIKGENAGTLEVVVREQDAGGNIIAETVRYRRTASNYDWLRFTRTFTLDADTEKVRIYVRGYSPDTGESRLFVDELALVEWDERTYQGRPGFDLVTPNDWGYVRCRTSSSLSSSRLGLDLVHRTYASR